MSINALHSEQLDADMLSEAQDTLADLEILVSNMQSSTHTVEDGLADILRHAKRIKAFGFSADFPLIDLTLHRLINYAEIVQNMTESRFNDLNTFLDILRGLLEGTIEKSSDPAEFVRSLPVARSIDIADLESLNIEILMIDPQKMSAHLFERELRSAGYRVMISHRSFEAMELAVQTKPDLIICSFVIDALSGVDVARALKAIPATSNIPFALLTSYDKDAPGMELLPDNTGYIRKGSDFGEDLAQVLQRFAIS